MNAYIVTMKIAGTLTTELNKHRQNGDLLSYDEVAHALAVSLDKHDKSSTSRGRALADYREARAKR